MISRRKFNLALALLPSVTASSALNLSTVQDVAVPLQLTPRIMLLQAQVRPGEFSWELHNELRHEYLAVSERMSRKHADILLAHSIMDSYVLHTLSDWHLHESHPDPELAVVVLLNNAERYSDLVHLDAACTILAADTLRKIGRGDQARQLYLRVASAIFGPQSLVAYRTLAGLRLS